ncbi:MAG: hypothetical protein M3Q66_11755, partial [Chloroflexota bacterium]|nr:hypothetical protein [Chloroflexota bacterium]
TSYRSGAKMTIRFTGSSFYFLATTGRYQGRVRITIDGVSHTVDQGYYAGRRETGSHYRVVVFSKFLANKAHTVVLTNLGTSGRPTISVDAVAWRN